ncbi:expressed unknown protein [Seminavis robusta]|uniref:Uncharacterized protein n=1 Tax=Seminavis robusta TaxID=568900 RepID=A0A9N8H2P3_9STRA|nr:expressed unknown protein [Seminavis robusta]|eukprot:Sro40_g024950.1 n/a (81) ;mRNA; r:138224-138537
MGQLQFINKISLCCGNVVLMSGGGKSHTKSHVEWIASQFYEPSRMYWFGEFYHFFQMFAFCLYHGTKQTQQMALSTQLVA